MALEVGIVGLPGAGKTTIFNALTRAGAQVGAYSGPSGKEHVGMAEIADERLQKLAETVKAKKVTQAAIRVVDVPGTGPALLGNLRQVDAILVVLDGFSPEANPARDLETLELELLGDAKKVELDALLLIDGDKITVGAPIVDGVKVHGEVLEEVKGEKLKILKFKAKKRIKRLTGHRQHYSLVKITKIG